MPTWDEYAAEVVACYPAEIRFLAENVDANATLAHIGGGATALRADSADGWYLLATNHPDICVVGPREEAKGLVRGNWLIGVYRAADQRIMSHGQGGDFVRVYQAALAAAKIQP